MPIRVITLFANLSRIKFSCSGNSIRCLSDCQFTLVRYVLRHINPFPSYLIPTSVVLINNRQADISAVLTRVKKKSRRWPVLHESKKWQISVWLEKKAKKIDNGFDLHKSETEKRRSVLHECQKERHRFGLHESPKGTQVNRSSLHE